VASREIVFSPQAERDIKELSKQHQVLVISALEEWALGADRHQTEKIKSQPSFYRLKVGCLRIFYYPLTQGRVVVLMIKDRKEAYRNLEVLPVKLATAIRRLKVAGESRP
jgi:mRNA interferase RelE/StbE